MTNAERIKALKDQGWKVRVMHLRATEFPDEIDYEELLTTWQMRDWNSRFGNGRHKLVPASRGGETIVRLLDGDDKQIAWGWSACSIRDNFCKGTGLTIALNRLEADLTARLADRPD